jgi:hypothetical protein
VVLATIFKNLGDVECVVLGPPPYTQPKMALGPVMDEVRSWRLAVDALPVGGER